MCVKVNAHSCHEVSDFEMRKVKLLYESAAGGVAFNSTAESEAELQQIALVHLDDYSILHTHTHSAH